MAACYRYWSQLVMPHLILLFMFTQFPTAVMHPNSIVCLSSRNTWLGMLDYNCWWNEYRPDVWGQLTSNLLVGLIKFSVESFKTLMCGWSELRHLPQHSLFYIRGQGCTSSRPILMGLATVLCKCGHNAHALWDIFLPMSQKMTSWGSTRDTGHCHNSSFMN